MNWLKHYIHGKPEPKKSTGRCHGYGQTLQQIPSWILLKRVSIWIPLAWQYRLQRERWCGGGVGFSSSGLRLRGNT